MKSFVLVATLLTAGPSLAQASDCVGIVPDDLGGSVQQEVPHGASPACFASVVDQGGVVAAASFEPRSFRFYLYGSDGTPRGSFDASTSNVIPQASGFIGPYRDSNFTGTLYVNKWDDTGTVVNQTVRGGDMCGVETYPASTGGALATGTCPASAFLDRYDDAGNLAGSMATLNDRSRAIAVGDELGNNLVVYFPGTEFGFGATDFVGRWYDDSANPISDPFLIASNGSYRSSYVVRALIGGGAAFRLEGNWIAFIPSGVASVESPPQFLVDNPTWDFKIVRGGRAYALLSVNTFPTYNQMPLYSAAGTFCGQLQFAADVMHLTVGADGTVVGSSGPGSCTKTWWPALLRGP